MRLRIRNFEHKNALVLNPTLDILNFIFITITVIKSKKKLCARKEERP